MAKPPIVSWVEDNWPEAECQIYGGLTGAAVSAAAFSAYTGQVWGVVGAGFVAGGAQLAADLAGCNKSPNIPSVPPGSEGNCWKGEGDGTLEYFRHTTKQWAKLIGFNVTEVLEVTQGDYNDFKAWNFTMRVSVENGQGEEFFNFADGGNPVQVRVTGRICDDEPLPDPPAFPEPIGEPFDPPVGDECNWSCQAVDAYVDGSGKLRVYTVCRSNNPEVCGGPVGFWTGGPEGPEFVNPDAPDTTDPDDDQPIPAPPPKPPSDPPCCKPPSVSIPGTTYQLRGVCEELPDGTTNQPVIEQQIPTLTDLQAVSARIDALIPLLQGQKDFKQPTCPPVKPEGEFRTIGFISEKTSPYGKSRLRKRLRYRSMSGIGLNALIDHWKDFQFVGGAVIVKHRGASWGTLTVWASTADEGKRVIRHAAGEAGIDADSVGRWEISGSSSTRLGVSDTMKVNTKGGFYWITNRDGSDGRPLVGAISP